MAEIKIDAYQLPAQIEFNYDDLYREVEAICKTAGSLVYTDDEIRLAKADRARLNGMAKALNDERIKREREYMRPFEDFKNKVATLCKMIKDASGEIDERIKEYEGQQRELKRAKLKEIFAKRGYPEWVKYEQIENPKWLNASVTELSIIDDMNILRVSIEVNVEMLSRLPEFAFEALEVYKDTLDLAKALKEADTRSQMALKKADACIVIPEEQDEASRVEMDTYYYSVRMNLAQKNKLEAWLFANGMEWREM